MLSIFLLFSLTKIRTSQPPMARHQSLSLCGPAPGPTKSDAVLGAGAGDGGGGLRGGRPV